MCTFRSVLGSAGIVLAALFAFAFTPALAAPQPLALVQTHGPIDLNCSAGECSVELTTFCLDSSRFSPPRGTEYKLAGDGLVRLTGTTADGRSVTLDADHARFTSARRHFAVRVSIDRSTLGALEVDGVTVEVATDVALLPVPLENDPTAISEGEADLFTGPLRRLGSAIVDSDGTRMQAARITSRMINRLPQYGHVSRSQSESVWREATAASGKGISSKAVKRARGVMELCRYVARVEGPGKLRRCLQSQHDGMIDFLNAKYWKALQTGT